MCSEKSESPFKNSNLPVEVIEMGISIVKGNEKITVAELARLLGIKWESASYLKKRVLTEQ